MTGALTDVIGWPSVGRIEKSFRSLPPSSHPNLAGDVLRFGLDRFGFALVTGSITLPCGTVCMWGELMPCRSSADSRCEICPCTTLTGQERIKTHVAFRPGGQLRADNHRCCVEHRRAGCARHPGCWTPYARNHTTTKARDRSAHQHKPTILGVDQAACL